MDDPTALDDLLASTVEYLKINGSAREIAILLACQPSCQHTEHDNWNGGIDYWQLALLVELRLYAQLSDTEREEAAQKIQEAARMFFGNESDILNRVVITPKPVTNPRWREDAKEWISGKGVTNQGRVRSDNPASREVDGLLFRSREEINLYMALKMRGITFAPLPVFLRGGVNYRRLEPDFVLLKDGVVMVVEVDGPYHRESPAEAHRRLQPMALEGARTERVEAGECETPELAAKCAAKLLAILEKHTRMSK